ncbi:tRNA (guanosine(37)-N1)-methyltransferase TrmD [Methylomonas sp. LW13]|uniref:tRNA (guanosine(37)-N1)-methyltransferase TrmD n=1 Tax=unclassified Methylomonas TaxID=2608980 RepID=UPI00051ACE7E|nr:MULTISPECIES: tRNA (guanosine(37)-N1)-methyltransferase TrmD [unclassified Methylomonas]PKD41755.1 tRNA (guanosine(37)-N1)-methyltransferase TrmD [Methylomonas sp. Kb3]QBC26265.1 tRNA (guanosine(37)-N1)-methyltransferase TrmD [Methylomonas sp. LW13]
MRFDVISLFPDMVSDAAGYGVTGRAIERGLVDLSVWNPRDYTHDKHRTVDDRPYGGGPGMVMKCQPLLDAVDAAKQHNALANSKVICLSPQGRLLDQELLLDASCYDQLILVSGRYEGIDERFIQHACDEEWSLGDYVISGGELAALVVIDAVTRLIPGVLGDEESAKQDSHFDGLLDCPHYTRPEHSDIGDVPDVLLGGNHAEIKRWRMKQALGRTWSRRPDMLGKVTLSAEQDALLKEFRTEVV